jgi:hypothetical protein
LGNVATANVFATGAGGRPTAAVWGSSDVLGGGKLVLLMDVNWAQNSFRDASTMTQVAQNVAAFLH